jgi:tol-pal system protein YbgF
MARWFQGAAAGIAAGSLLLVGVAMAQTMDQDPAVLAAKLQKVERELRDLQWQMSKMGGVPSADADGEFGVPAVPGSTPQKYDDIEQTLRRLTGEVEQLSFEVKKLQDQYASFQRDTQFRLSALEGGAPASVAGLAAPVPAGQPAVPGGGAPMNLNTAPTPPKGVAPGPGTLGTMPAGAAPALATTPAGASPEDQYNAALNLLTKQQYTEAQAAFRAFALANPKHKLAGTAQFYAADIDFVQKNYPAAAQGFTAVLRGFPSSPRAPDAMLKLGLSLVQAGDKKNGCLTLGALKQKYPSANGEILNRAGKARLQHGC